MRWPDKPTCHGRQDPLYPEHKMEWWTRAGEDRRTCSYCGCVHPADLLRLIEAGAEVGGSDWKYGWPHKFYVTTPSNPEQKGIWAKWYNEHLKDAGYDDEALALLLAKLEKHSGIRFELDGGRLRYRAPHAGYRR